MQHAEHARYAGQGYSCSQIVRLLWSNNAIVVPDVPNFHYAIICELNCRPFWCALYPKADLLVLLLATNDQMTKLLSMTAAVICAKGACQPLAKAGELMPLPVAEAGWADIRMDVVGPLPPTEGAVFHFSGCRQPQQDGLLLVMQDRYQC